MLFTDPLTGHYCHRPLRLGIRCQQGCCCRTTPGERQDVIRRDQANMGNTFTNVARLLLIRLSVTNSSSSLRVLGALIGSGRNLEAVPRRHPVVLRRVHRRIGSVEAYVHVPCVWNGASLQRRRFTGRRTRHQGRLTVQAVVLSVPCFRMSGLALCSDLINDPGCNSTLFKVCGTVSAICTHVPVALHAA